MLGIFFDVDGVITDPQKKQVTENELYNQIIIRLKNREPICFNTGRSIEWLRYRFISTLLEKIIEPRYIAIGEKGGTSLTIDEKGNMHHGKLAKYNIPDSIITEVKELVRTKYNDSNVFRFNERNYAIN